MVHWVIADANTGPTRYLRREGNDAKPILLLLIYAKARQDNLTDSQKVQLKKLVEAIFDEFA